MKFTLLALMFPLAASAGEIPAVQCTLSSGKASHMQTAKLELNKEDMMLSDSGYIYDLSFDLVATCGAADCEINVTYYSGKMEEEVGRAAWTVNPETKAAGVFFSEKLEGNSDNRDYRFECALVK